MKRPIILVAIALLAGCTGITPTTPPPDSGAAPTDASVLPLTLAPPPPAFVTDSLAATGLTFRLPTIEELRKVGVGADQARNTALAIGPQAYGEAGGEVVWTRVGCEFLGHYEARAMPNHGESFVPERFPAYLVQILGDPVPDWPGINVEVVVVNAATGERGTIFGGGLTAGMGTTCGILP